MCESQNYCTSTIPVLNAKLLMTEPTCVDHLMILTKTWLEKCFASDSTIIYRGFQTHIYRQTCKGNFLAYSKIKISVNRNPQILRLKAINELGERTLVTK